MGDIDRLVTGRTPTFPGVRTDSRPHWRGRRLPVPVQLVWLPRLRGRLADLLAPWHVDAYRRAINKASRTSHELTIERAAQRSGWTGRR